MKNRLSALAAGTAICAILAAPAIAGYTIYEDSEMPSVLFFEFDEPEGDDPMVISAPGGSSAPVVLGGTAADPNTDPSQGQGGGSAFADNEGDGDSQPSFEEQMDDAMTIDNDRIRDVVVDEAIRQELLRDTELR